MFLGEDLLPWMVLAFGAALAVGNLLALLRPPPPPRDGAPDESAGEDAAVRLERPPLARSLVMIGIGLVAALWAGVSLLR